MRRGAGGRPASDASAKTGDYVVSGRLDARPEALGRELFGDGLGAARRFEITKGFVRRADFRLTIAEPAQRCFGFRQGGAVWPLFLDAAAAHGADRLGGSGDAAPTFDGEEPLLRLRDVFAQPLDFRLKESLGGAVGIAIGFKRSDRLRALMGERLVAGLQRRRNARLQIGDPRFCGGDARRLFAVLPNRQSERLFGALQRVRRVADLLVEKQQRVSIRELLFRRSGCASNDGYKGLEHRQAPFYEQCSFSLYIPDLNNVQEKSERCSKMLQRGLMGSKTAIRRERQRQALIEAAEAAIALGGLSNLKAREIASEAGCALGAIYNLVEDMDEIVLRVGSRTLARLDAALREAAAGRPLNSIVDAVERLVSIAIAYCRFAAANRNLWRTLFEHQMTDAKPPPAWSIEEQMRLFEHASAPLRLLMKEASNSEVLMMSRTVFAAVHGIVLLGVEQKMISVPPASLERSIEKFVRLSCAGLVHAGSSRKA